MPSGFDDFSALADRDYSDVSETAAGNARLLEAAMTEAGFTGYSAEWWHYTDVDGYPVCEPSDHSRAPARSARRPCSLRRRTARANCRNPHWCGAGASGQRRVLCARALRRKLRCYLPAGCISEG